MPGRMSLSAVSRKFAITYQFRVSISVKRRRPVAANSPCGDVEVDDAAVEGRAHDGLREIVLGRRHRRAQLAELRDQRIDPAHRRRGAFGVAPRDLQAPPRADCLAVRA